MTVETVRKPAFSVIGKEGSTCEGEGFIEKLWQQANEGFGEITDLAKRNDDGSFAGFFGAMTDFSRSFRPWENGFSEGLYLAGVECREDAEAPEGWTKWNIPGFIYLRIADEENTFFAGLEYIKAEGLSLAGAVHDFTDIATGKSYMLFPIGRL